MTPRILLSLIGTLALFAVGAGSCQRIDNGAPALALAPVGAPPPGFEMTRATAEPGWRSVSEATQVNAAGEPFSARAIEAYLTSRHTGLSRSEIHRLSGVIIAEALRHGVEPGLVLAVIEVESTGYHRAVSPVGALGLMQILPSTGEELASKHGVTWYGAETLFDPVVNVKLGTAYLKELSDRYDHVPTALAAYNWGPSRIDRRLRQGSSLPEIYVKRVMQAYDGVGDHLAMHTTSS